MSYGSKFPQLVQQDIRYNCRNWRNAGTLMSMALVLVVDDDTLSLQLLELMLKREQHVVLTSASNTDTVDLIYQHQPDLVILNDNMPHVSGGEMCKRIKTDPRICQTPVVLTSAGQRVRDPNYVRESRADGVLYKPCVAADVRTCVNQHLR